MTNPSRNSYLIMALLVVGIAVAGYYVLNTPDRRDTGQKIGDALEALPDGVDKAAEQLESRTPGEKLGDAAKDMKDDVKKTLNQQ
jgi:hypothetical protein